MIDTDRIDISKPIDLAAICNTGLYSFVPDMKEFGVHLTDEVSFNHCNCFNFDSFYFNLFAMIIQCPHMKPVVGVCID